MSSRERRCAHEKSLGHVPLHPAAGRLRRANRAGIGTGSAIDAFCGVDDVFSVAGFNCSDGAVFCAGSAFDAKIVDFVSHGDILLKKILF